MWQLLLILYFILGTASTLLRKVLAQQLGQHNRIINSIFFIFFLLPAAIVLTIFFPHNLNVGLANLIFLLGGSIVWPLVNIFSFRANKEVDVGIFTIITNVSPIFTFLIAIPFMKETLTVVQEIGIALLILSGIVAAASQLKKLHAMNMHGLWFCVLSAATMGIGVAYERLMLSRVDFGAYMVFGWGAQIVWSLILAHKQLAQLPTLFSKGAKGKHTIIWWGLTKVLSSTAFILSLKISGSASLISAATDFLSVSVVIAAYFYLKEHSHIWYKSLAVIMGVGGLLLIAR